MWTKMMLALSLTLRHVTSFSFVTRRLLRHCDQSRLFQVPRFRNDEIPSQPPTRPHGIDSLLQSAFSRAERTLSYRSEHSDNSDNGGEQQATSSVAKWLENEERDRLDMTLNYNNNPTIANIALAHSLWSHVLRPGIDTAIDATAGNGKDSLVLAEILFSQPSSLARESKLFCIDIQKSACENTERRLSSKISPQIMCEHVRIMHTSHAPLPVTREAAPSVGLVVYNLGFLPQSDTKNHVTTQTDSTITSLTDASLLIRVGGMLSVMTYPRTNQQEHLAVAAFLEGLALLSSSSNDWSGYLDALSENYEVRNRVDKALQRVQSLGKSDQTWRVHQHSKVGWTDAPTLFTATRIK